MDTRTVVGGSLFIQPNPLVYLLRLSSTLSALILCKVLTAGQVPPRASTQCFLSNSLRAWRNDK